MNESQEPLPEHQNEAPQESIVQAEDLQARIDELRPQQNLLMGTLGGLTGAIVGALIWAGITVATDYQIGYMALGVGYLVGMGMRTLGKGIDPIFGYVGASLALLGCLLGNVFSLIYYIAQESGLTHTHLLTVIDYSTLPTLLWETSSYTTLLFYGIAVYEGYQLAFRKIIVG